MSDLRRKLIHLAHSKPELRPDLLPLLRTAGDLESEVAAILTKLKVNKGGRGSRQKLKSDPDWEIGFWESPRDIQEKRPYTLALTYKGRDQTVRLKPEEVESRSKGMWRRDKVWHLTPQTIRRLAPNVVGVIEKVRAQQPRGASSKTAYPRMPPAPRATFLPKDNPTLKQEKTPEGLEIWTWDEKGKPYGIAWAGQARKPLWYYRFLSEGDRDKRIRGAIEGHESREKMMRERREERKNFQHDFKVGDILSGSWGYDQTNVNFYEVVALPTPKMIALREVGKKVVRSSLGADYVVPTPGKYIGPVLKKKPSPGGYVRVTNSISVSKWSGKPMFETAAGYGH